MANDVAKRFYEAHGVKKVAPAYEVQPVDDAVLMETKHCIRYALGGCPVHHKKRLKHPEPLTLVGLDGKRFPLAFDCKRLRDDCQEREGIVCNVIPLLHTWLLLWRINFL